MRRVARPPDPHVRMLALLVVLALAGTLLVGRLGQLQLVDGPPAGDALAAPDTRVVAVPALRGRILDREGRPLADHAVRTDVTIDRRVLADAEDGGRGLVRDVAETLDLPFARLWARTTLCGAPGAAAPPRCWPGSALVPVPVAEGVDERTALALTDTPERYPGVAVVAQPVAAGVDLEEPVPCTSSYRIGDRTFANFESRAYGTISWRTAMVVSCDTVFYRVAEQVWRDQGGSSATTDDGDPLITTARDLGLGEPTGVDLPAEAPGRIPGRAWKRDYWEATKDEACRRAQEGYPGLADRARAAYLQRLARESCERGDVYLPGDEANLSIGQGDVTATLLQMARVYGAVATGGRDPQPRLASALLAADGSRAELPEPPARRVDLPGESGPLLRGALREVVTKGTAAPAFRGADLDGWPVAGKTGTAEVFGEEDTSWFVSWAPAGATPRYVVAVVVDEGGTGGGTAAGIAREVHEHLAETDV